MSDDKPKSFNPRGLPRIPLKLKVNMEFEKFSGFISEYSGNISEGGMFIQTNDPRPIGSVFSLEFKLKDDYKLIQGWGEVVWVREKAQGEKKPPGMGIQFLDLDSSSRELIRNIIRIHKKDSPGQNIHPFDFMKTEDSSQKSDANEGENLTDVTKEVFEEKPIQPPKQNDVVVDDIFKDINTEMTISEESLQSGEAVKSDALDGMPNGANQQEASLAPQEPSTNKATEIPNPEIQEPKPDEDKASSIDLGKAKAANPKEDASASFIDEVFGKNSLSKKSSKSNEKVEQALAEEKGEKDHYRKISWYSNPATVMLFLIVVLIITTGFLFKGKIIQTAVMIKAYYLDKKAPPFKAPRQKPIERKTQAPKKVAPKTEDKAALTAKTASPTPTKTQTPAPTKTKKITPSPTPKITSTVNRASSKPLPNFIKSIKLTPYKSTAIKATFDLGKKPRRGDIQHEMLTSPPRYLVKILGVNRLYKRRQFTIANNNLKRIRMGLHKNPWTIHIVFDLAPGTKKSQIRFSDEGKSFSLTVLPKK